MQTGHERGDLAIWREPLDLFAGDGRSRPILPVFPNWRQKLHVFKFAFIIFPGTNKLVCLDENGDAGGSVLRMCFSARPCRRPLFDPRPRNAVMDPGQQQAGQQQGTRRWRQIKSLIGYYFVSDGSVILSVPPMASRPFRSSVPRGASADTVVSLSSLYPIPYVSPFPSFCSQELK